MQCRDRRQQGLRLGAAGAEGGDEQGFAGRAGAGKGGQHAAGAELQVRADALLVKAGDSVGEPDRVADVADPVLGRAALVLVGQTARHIGDDRNAWVVERQTLGHAPEFRQHWFHVRGVEGVADP